MQFKNLFRKKSLSDAMNSGSGEHGSLGKVLSAVDLTALGIAAIIGAGIFTTIGKASADGGPGVVFLFIFTALACSFAAFAYAEFASLVPVSGSAYTYSYVAFGELVAWIIGWALIMEYAIGNVTVAIGWSSYLTTLLEKINIDAWSIHGIHLPAWMTTDVLTASHGFKEATAMMQSGKTFENLGEGIQKAYLAYTSAPVLLGIHCVVNVPALAITAFITWLVYRGIRESRNASNIMVAIKLMVVVLVIVVGAGYVDTANWNPFMPNGVAGVLKGVSAVFFAYIGFDAISTTAEECKNPQRDLPKGMMWAIIICTTLYVILALVLTGMINFKELDVADPLAHVFDKLNISWMVGIVAVSAVVAMASVLLVFQIGQPRIWMSMSRDGLLPKRFAKVHPKFLTPSFSTLITGLIVGAGTLFLNIDMVTDLCSIGTLFAFVLVCGGVLKLNMDPNRPASKFKTPYVNAKYIFGAMILVAAFCAFQFNGKKTMDFITNAPKTYEATTLITSLTADELELVTTRISETAKDSFEAKGNDLEAYLAGLNEENYESTVASLPIPDKKKHESGFTVFRHKIPTWIFILSSLALAVFAYRYNASLIPMLGLTSCLYMMSELGYKNWMYFMIWLGVGLLIYFGYSYKNSRLNKV
jgi:APA family basic amino acid/polyamine antiporter